MRVFESDGAAVGVAQSRNKFAQRRDFGAVVKRADLKHVVKIGRVEIGVGKRVQRRDASPRHETKRVDIGFFMPVLPVAGDEFRDGCLFSIVFVREIGRHRLRALALNLLRPKRSKCATTVLCLTSAPLMPSTFGSFSK